MLLELLQKLSGTKSLILTVEWIEQMVLVCGLELLRFAINVHCRGVRLSSAGRFDHFMNLCRAAISKDVLIECTSFADTSKSEITAWNDNLTSRANHLRSHLMHYEGNFMVGYGINVFQKKGWNGHSLDGLRTSEKELRKKLRVLTFNDDLKTEFTPPIFNIENGTFDLKVVDDAPLDGLDKPLIPVKTSMKTLFR